MLASYLIGAIPFGYLIIRLGKGFDIRHHGSGNIGATNVVRVAGLAWGVPVFILDFLKGAVPAIVATTILREDMSAMPVLFQLTAILTVVVAVAGHNWPVYLGFHGGKGVATSIGAVAGLSLVFPYLRIPVLASIVTWLVLFLSFRIVSLGSMAAAIVFFGVCLGMPSVPVSFKGLSFLLCLFIVLRHRKNFPEIARRFSK